MSEGEELLFFDTFAHGTTEVGISTLPGLPTLKTQILFIY